MGKKVEKPTAKAKKTKKAKVHVFVRVSSGLLEEDPEVFTSAKKATARYIEAVNAQFGTSFTTYDKAYARQRKDEDEEFHLWTGLDLR